MRNELVIGTRLDTEGFEEGLEEIKDMADDEQIEINTEKTSVGMKAISKLTTKIGSKMLGISVASARLLVNITGMLAKIGIIGAVLGTVALVVIGIAGAFKKAVKNNEELQQKINYLKIGIMGIVNALGSAGGFLVKVFSWIIDRVLGLLKILGAIIKLITGINIFADSVADNFGKSNTNATKLRKTLAGFDEMNVINGEGGSGLLGDLSTDIANLKSLQEEVEKTSNKIKEWFAKGFPTREEVEEMWKPARDMWSSIGDWLDKNVISYWRTLFVNFAEFTKPLWQPVADAFKKAFGPLYDYIVEKFINPIAEKFNTFKDNFLKKYAKFLNTIIYWINTVFGMWGVNLEYIDEESAITGKDVEEKIGGALKKVKEDSDKTQGSIGNLITRLKELTSKTWKFVINLVTSGNINQKLQPLRDALSQIGVNLPNIQLARGGIINMPGRGVPVGSAIGGERGQEGVIPLTDSQQMALLGEAIGKYISINATVPVYVGNRLVLREMKRIEAEDNFAYNR